MDVTEQAIRVKCQTWAESGKAQMDRPMDGGKPRWVIREDADPALAPIKFPEQLALDATGLNEKYLRKLQNRLAIYFDWDRACRSIPQGGSVVKTTADFIQALAAKGFHITPGTLYQWHKRYRAKGREGLIDERWRRFSRREANPATADPMLAEAARLYLLPNRLRMKICWELACGWAIEHGHEIRTYKRTLRHFKQSIPAAVRIQRRGGRRLFTDTAETFIERDYSTLASNALWNADHHVFDVLVEASRTVDPKTGEERRTFVRPWLTAWQDVRSRKIVAWVIYLDDPNTDPIILTLHKGILSHGVPQVCVVDNGKDFDSFALHGRTKRERHIRVEHDAKRIAGVFNLLGISAHNTQTYHGQSKPIERFFGTLEERFGKLWDSYCGNKPENRPDGLAERLEAGKAPTLAVFVEAFAEWVEADYNAREHFGDSMDGKSPNRVFDENLSTKVTAPIEVLEILLQKSSKPVKVTRNGVTWNGLRYGKYASELKRFLGQKVTLRIDPHDVSRVSVWDDKGLFVCVAPANHRLPANADPALLREAIKEKRRDRKAQLAYQESHLRIHDALPDRMSRLAAQRQAQSATPSPVPPPNIRPVRSPIEAQLPAVQRALKAPLMRQAAGAEGLDMLALANAELDLPTRPTHRSSFSLLTALNDPTDGFDGGASCP
ncbi:MAG: transposase domain-containing protein [Phycisphaerae bacterium]